MHVHCPNCQSSFEIRLQNLPSPKFNTAHQTFGWKFECGHCDTQWWISLGHDSDHHYGMTKQKTTIRHENSYPSTHDMLYDIVQPTTQHSMRMALKPLPAMPYTNAHINPHYPSKFSPISKDDYGFNPVSFDPPQTTNDTDRPLTLLVATPKAKRLNKKKPWLLFILIAFICSGIGVFEYYFPKKINQFIASIDIQEIQSSTLEYLKTFLKK